MVASIRCGASNRTSTAGSWLNSASRRRLAPAEAGRNPMNRNPSPSRPAADSRATTALAPGIGTTGNPASCAAATIRLPGSLIAGVPASVTNATLIPCCRRPSTCCAACTSLCAWAGKMSGRIPRWASKVRLTRVSSAATLATVRSTWAARVERSSRLPIGVATTKSVAGGRCGLSGAVIGAFIVINCGDQL